MKIGCDIGGVIKNLTNDDPLPGALDALKTLTGSGHEIIFISKCGPSFEPVTLAWLQTHGLADIPVFFCDSYIGKVEIASKQKIAVMIDDKTQVLKLFPDTRKIWLCSEEQKITGTRKFHPELFSELELCRTWEDVLNII
jgi:ribonucleotide monophosphatase NagD (HAD superfamily)